MSGIEENVNTKKIAYALVWRNEDKDHYHAPYLGHNSVSYFLEFYHNSRIMFNADLPNLCKN